MRWQPFFMPRLGAYFNGSQFIANKFVAKKFRARPAAKRQKFQTFLFAPVINSQHMCAPAGGGAPQLGVAAFWQLLNMAEPLAKAKTALKFNLGCAACD